MIKFDPDRQFGKRECPSCGVEVGANHNDCPICGYLFPHPSVRQRSMKLWGAFIMLALLLYAYVVIFM
jgi:hypothetical protein